MVWLHLVVGGDGCGFLCRIFDYTEIRTESFFAFFDEACESAAAHWMGRAEWFWSVVSIDMLSIYAFCTCESCGGFVEYEEEKLFSYFDGGEIRHDFYN